MKKFWISLGSVIIVLLVFMPLQKRIVIMDEDSIIYMMPRNVLAFEHSYIHSVSKTFVVEHYQIKGNHINLDSVLYQSQGAGLPEEESSFGKFSHTEKGFRMEYLSMEMDSVNLFVQEKYENTIYYTNKKFELNQDAFKEKRAYIKVKQLTLLESWLYRLHDK